MKKKVFGLLMAAVLCLCLLPVGVGATTGTEEKTLWLDTVDSKSGGMKQGSTTRTAVVLEDSDQDAEWANCQSYVVNKNVTIEGNLTIGGNSDIDLILCNGATLTIKGALILQESRLLIWGHTETQKPTDSGQIVIENSKKTLRCGNSLG